MSKTKEIRNKITSIQKTRKITGAMQMVAAGKRRKVELRVKLSLPYAKKIHAVIQHMLQSNSEYRRHVYLQERSNIRRVGILIVSSDRGLCGSLNINLFKKTLLTIQEWQAKNINVDLFLIGNKAGAFFKNLNLNIKSQTKSFGDTPKMADLIGITTAMRDAYKQGEIDKLFLAHNEFISTIEQKPHIKQLLPLLPDDSERKQRRNWDYIYEPNSITVLKTLLVRRIETEVYQAVINNIACEQVARMLAMQNATENASKFIADLEIVYNKIRQTAITQEIAEIIGGAAAV